MELADLSTYSMRVSGCQALFFTDKVCPLRELLALWNRAQKTCGYWRGQDFSRLFSLCDSSSSSLGLCLGCCSLGCSIYLRFLGGRLKFCDGVPGIGLAGCSNCCCTFRSAEVFDGNQWLSGNSSQA